MKKVFFLIIAATIALSAMAQEQFKRCIFVNGTDTLPYRELAPERPEADQYPLVIFMHGAGERGIDNEKQLTHGAQMWLNPINRKKYPAWVTISVPIRLLPTLCLFSTNLRNISSSYSDW